MGRYKWSPTTSKTVEGSAALTISVVAFAWVLRVCGLVEEFSVSEYDSATMTQCIDVAGSDHAVRDDYWAWVGAGGDVRTER